MITSRVAALILFCLGCTSQQSGQLTDQQKIQIKTELRTVVDTMMAKFVRLDGEGFLAYFHDSPEFVAYYPDGARSDFQTFKKAMLDFCSSGGTARVTNQSEEFTVLTKEYVVCSFTGKSELTTNTGDKVIYNPYAATWIFRNISGEWRIVYSHESATITTEKAGKQ